MVEAIVGIIIATTSSMALLIAISVSINSLEEAGKTPLSKPERNMIKNAGYNDNDLEILNLDLKKNSYE